MSDFDLNQPERTAAALGYRMPGEFEPIDAVWLTYPHNRETWPGCFERACEQYDDFIAQVARFAQVNLIGKAIDWPTNDSWIRDYGPLFVINQTGELACHDFVFNGWGGKYNAEYERDGIVPRRVAERLGIPTWLHDEVLEGGSIEVNGAGVVMTTEQCLLNQNRNRALDRPKLEALLHESLGTRHVLWLPGGIEGDDTDGHIDDVARFIAPGAIAAVRAPAGHPDHDTLERNWSALREARDANGEAFELFELPAPEPIEYDYPPDRFGPGGVNPVPASHANFLIVNAAVLVPTFGQRSDELALHAIERALPGRQAIGVRSEWLVVGLGALHCLSMQQPKSATMPRR